MRKTLLCFLLACCLHAADFSFIILPDPHAQQNTNSVAWVNQTSWISSNLSADKIAFVGSSGDLTWDPNHTNAPPNFWQNQLIWTWSFNSLLNGFSQIDSLGVPWTVSSGNHDCETALCSPTTGDSTTTFDANDYYSQVSAHPWFVTYYPDSSGNKSNTAIRFFVGPRAFLVVSMEYEPRTVVLTWAAGVINSYPNSEVVIFTHKLLTTTGTLDTTNEITGGNTGQAVDTWAQQFPNLRAIFCGHNLGGTGATGHHAYRAMTASDGHTVHEWFTNYQDVSTGGFGNPYFSNVILLVQFTGSTVTINQVNGTSGAIDNTTYPPYSETWVPGRMFPMPGAMRGR